MRSHAGNSCVHALSVFLMFSMFTACSDSGTETGVDVQRLEVNAGKLARKLEERSILSPSPTRGIQINLAFGAESDLDLYVTDPLLETVYFANHESKSGGKISPDVGCDIVKSRVGPGIETVSFKNPVPGHYRVGVDYPQSCNEGRGAAAYAISVEGSGVDKYVQGWIEHLRFKVIVLEFEVSG